MQEEIENNKSTSLIPVGSQGLIRLGNYIAITEKLLKESNLYFFQQFEGEIKKTIEINLENYYTFLFKRNDELCLINKYGNIIKIDTLNGTFLEIKTLYNSLNSMKENAEEIFYQPHKICSYFNDGTKIYISNGYEDVFVLQIDDFTLTTKKLNQSVDNNEFNQYFSFFPLKNFIFSYSKEDDYDEYSQEYSLDTRYIKLLDKDTFEVFKQFKAIEDFFYFNMLYSNGFVFAINENGDEDYKGKILKQSTIDFTYSFIDAFENSWVEEFKILSDNTIICYSNYIEGDNDSVLRIIDSSDNKIIFEIKFVKKEIRSFSLSENKNVLALLFNDGEVLLYGIKFFQLEKVKQFQYNELIETDYEVNPIHSCPPHIFEFVSNQIIIGNRKRINIYK